MDLKLPVFHKNCVPKFSGKFLNSKPGREKDCLVGLPCFRAYVIENEENVS